MKTIKEILKNYKDYETFLEDRFGKRLSRFLTLAQMKKIGVSYVDPKDAKKHKPIAWNKRNILCQLKKDVAFGFEMALGHRGIFAGLMYSVVQSWCKVLENGLEDTEYPMYGLPLFKAVAEMYGFDNPIGKDTGSEEKYDE